MVFVGGIAGLDILFWPGPGTEHMLSFVKVEEGQKNQDGGLGKS